MLLPDEYLVFLQPLNASAIRYMVTGSVAAIIYGEPRFTYDIDLVMELTVEDIPSLITLFNPEEFYCPPAESIATEIARQLDGHFNIIHHATGFKADIYPAGSDPLHKWAMARCRKITVDQCDIYLAPPEYVIIRKLQYYKEGGSEKHLRDIKRMTQLSTDLIDDVALQEKLSEFNLSDEWKAALDFHQK